MGEEPRAVIAMLSVQQPVDGSYKDFAFCPPFFCCCFLSSFFEQKLLLVYIIYRVCFCRVNH